MSATAFNFDNWGLFDLLTGAGVPEKQARAQVEAIRKTVVETVAAVREEVKVEVSAQVAEVKAEVKKEVADHRLLDEKTRQELATKGDVGDLKIECAKIRADAEVKLAQLSAQLSTKIEQIKSETVKTVVSPVVGSTVATIVGMSAIMLFLFGHYWGK
ncbi:hypothetical protein AGMMS49959_12770 [Planctomycetales bacterium]|nr:hypothetical protein AGMMS49959_12770 [Planctomycetales bacterium]